MKPKPFVFAAVYQHHVNIPRCFYVNILTARNILKSEANRTIEDCDKRPFYDYQGEVWLRSLAKYIKFGLFGPVSFCYLVTNLQSSSFITVYSELLFQNRAKYGGIWRLGTKMYVIITYRGILSKN